MEPADEERGAVHVENRRLSDAVVLIGAILNVLADRAQPVVALTNLVIGDVHVVTVGVGTLRMPGLIFTGARDRAVAFAHVAQTKVLVGLVFPVFAQAFGRRGGALDEQLEVTARPAAVLISLGFAVERVIPIAEVAHRAELNELGTAVGAATWVAVVEGGHITLAIGWAPCGEVLVGFDALTARGVTELAVGAGDGVAAVGVAATAAAAFAVV